MIERNFRAAFAWGIQLAGADADPVDLAGYSVGLGLASDTTDANNRIESKSAN